MYKNLQKVKKELLFVLDAKYYRSVEAVEGAVND